MTDLGSPPQRLLTPGPAGITMKLHQAAGLALLVLLALALLATGAYLWFSYTSGHANAFCQSVHHGETRAEVLKRAELARAEWWENSSAEGTRSLLVSTLGATCVVEFDGDQVVDVWSMPD